MGLLACSAASAQESPDSPFRLGGLVPGGVRSSVTESWGSLDFSLTNRTSTDRQARVMVFYTGQPDVQYGRDVWLPGNATLSTWLLVGPAAAQDTGIAREIQILLYDRSDGQNRLLLPANKERIRSRLVLYRKREPYTATLLDEEVPEPPVFGQLPQPDSHAAETVQFVRLFRAARSLSELVPSVNPGNLPPTPEAFDGIDHLVIASERLAHDVVGLEAFRQWLQRGGKVWVMLDLVDPEVLAPLLGEAFDFQLVDRVSLNRFKMEQRPNGQLMADQPQQEHEQPVEIARVLLPPRERAEYTVNGWPVWFTRSVGRGLVVFTTLGPRGWYRPRGRRDQDSPYINYPSLPVPTAPLETLAGVLEPPPAEDPFPIETFQPRLSEEIGYAVVNRGTVGLLFGGFLLATLGLGLALRRSRRPELLGWLGPVAALGAAAAFIAVGTASRRAAAPTVAVAQVVDPIAGRAEASLHGVLAVYRPESGPAEVGARQGGLFSLDMAGIEGQTRRLLLTDSDAWHWENLELPAGERFAPFRCIAPTGEPVAAVARLGPEGLEGKLTAGPFQEIADAVLSTSGGRNLAIRWQPDGSFRAGNQDILPMGQFLAGAVLNDVQQGRQELYRTLLKRPKAGQPESGNVLLAWAKPIDMHFTLAPDARTVGSALLVLPLQLERTSPGTQVTIPGPLIPYRRLLSGGAVRPLLESDQGIDMELRFQLPAAVLPLQIERARLDAKIDAPSRRITLAGRTETGTVEIQHVESPLDPIHVEIKDERWLHLDEEGGLHLNVTVSGAPNGGAPGQENEKWTIEYLELEVTGKTRP
jgi:hypothetical protein